MHAREVYDGSDGALTRRFYAALGTCGPLGEIAAHLFRAQKCSRRAKQYGPVAGVNGATYQQLAYARKAESLRALVAILGHHGAAHGFRFGWGRDETQSMNKWVLYVDVPEHGQVSFHSPTRFAGPDYPGAWDGRHASEHRIIEFCDRVLSTRIQNASLFETAL